jgi:nucleoid DNA-binding protein
MKSIKTDEFFRLVTLNSGVNDLRAVQDVFYGMVRTISRELKEKGEITLPDWGTFYLHVHKARKSVDVNNGMLRDLPAKTTVKFSPDLKVKKYFQELDKLKRI